MQAVLLPDHHRLLADVDALLRTFGIAQFAPDAFVRDEIAPVFLRNAAKGKRSPLDGLFGEIEPFPGPLIDFEHRQSAARPLVGVNFLHVRILREKRRQHVRPDFPCPAPDGNRRAGQGVVSLHARKGHVFIGFQPVIKIFPFCRQEIQSGFVPVHDVNSAGHRPPLGIGGGKYRGMDFLREIFQILLCNFLIDCF